MPWGAVVDMQRTLGSRPRQLLPHSSGVFLAGTRSQCRICSSRHSYSGTCFVYNHIVCVEVHRDSRSSVFSLLSGYHFSSKKSDRHACFDRAWAVEYAPSLPFNASNLDRCMGFVVDDLTIRLVDGGECSGSCMHLVTTSRRALASRVALEYRMVVRFQVLFGRVREAFDTPL